jgi:hypothetical protein
MSGGLYDEEEVASMAGQVREVLDNLTAMGAFVD